MEAVVPIIDEPQKLDLLDRQEFVDRMLTIAKALSNNKKSACYAVDGDWGVGKSFVLDMFEEQAKDIGVEGDTLSRYLLFRYNCWEYDYYEEPLVAIVASMLDQINEKIDLLPADTKTRIVAALKAVGKGLVKKAVQLVEEKTGVVIEEVLELVKDGADTAREEVKESHKYDQFFDFKKNLKKLRETISSLSAEQTLIFMVDELDRCLPEYTIKVLERLHHLFDGIPNVQVILSIDVGQLEHVVRQIYGEETDAKKYLRKFIQFELKLGSGHINDSYNNRFSEYTRLFEIQSTKTNKHDIGEFIGNILEDLDMRNRISIINRCELIHGLLTKDEVLDASYMCLEILLVLLQDSGLNIERSNQNFSISLVFNPRYFDRQMAPGLKLLSAKYESNLVPENMHQKFYDSRYDDFAGQHENYLNAGCLLGKLLCAYRSINGFEHDNWQYVDDERAFSKFIRYAKQFWEVLQIVQ